MTAKVIDKAGFFKKIGYAPHPRQWLYHNSPARFRLPNCGRRFGKSTMAGRDLEPRLIIPNRTYWIVGPTYDLGEKEFRVIWNDLIVGQRWGLEKDIKRAYNKKQGNMFIQFPWNTRLEVRSADHPENLVGEALDHAIMSEAAKHKQETWERFIRPALADRRGTADFPTTPEGYNWLYAEWMHGQDATMPEYESWRFPSWDNPFVYPGGRDDAEIRLLERTMTPEAFLQEIGADFGSFVGKIYPEWDIQKHVTNVPFIPELPNYLAIDWGYTNPSAWIEFQVTPQDEIRVWREHYRAYMTLPEHIDAMKNREQPEGYHLDLAFADAADPSAAATVTTNLVGCYAMPEAKEVWREGIDLVRSFMAERDTGRELDEYGTPELRPAFLVDFSCIYTIHEFNNYKAPGSVNGRNVPELGNKAQDHSMDAIRYGLMHLYKCGATSHLSDVYRPATGASSTSFAPHSSSDLVLAPSEGGYFTMGGQF